ncbi:hypothetical protein PV328_002638 [Microctonus aethiopoides]|uniref:C2HC/C3H-type domain-containing protein n=2 Tax=Microctonus aethiopoides TaxID=144406 RepID=A0AA39KJM9_9HYME|nr:hypothetical protein PV328_002638 [Microctonus aethiopoides]
MSTLHTSSRLELLQRQLMEKEQKLLQIYDQQQQRAHQAAQRGSAGSNTSNGSECGNSNAVSHQVTTKTTAAHAKSNGYGGKVRQMFDERRQTTVKGIDKSYPLEPLENKTRRVNGSIPIKNKNKNSIATRKNVTSKRTSGTETNGSIKKSSIPAVSYHEEVTRETFGPKLIHQDEDIDKFYNVDHVKTYYNRRHQYNHDVESRNDEKKFNEETTNLHAKNSEKTPSKDNNSNVVKISTTKNISSGSISKNITGLNSNTTKKIDLSTIPLENGNHLKNENKPPSRRQSSEIRQRSPSSTCPVSATISTTINDNNFDESTTENSPKIEMNTRSKVLTTGNKLISSSNRSNSSGAINGSTSACKVCGRRFSTDRINLHEQICIKTTKKKRKTFDITNQRVSGTEMETYVKKPTKKGQTEKKVRKPEAKSNWRKKHEDFINAIRSAKKTQAHLAAGGKLSDLPPPPPSDTSDYIQCPHCGRKFNQAAADRHIPKCEHMLHNKPNSRAPTKPKRY